MLVRIISLLLLGQAVACKNPVVKIPGLGSVKGSEESTVSGRTFYSFFALPFAQPPVEHLRFNDPLPSKGWKDELDGTKPPQACSQFPIDPTVGKEFKIVGQDDCLYLNIHTPKLPQSGDKLLPVLVHIHGGAYYVGSAAFGNPIYYLDYDVIMVSIQYRLGIFGFASTEDDEMPGNYGLKDQVLALKWVQDNIASFGGDPKRVTINGFSAGGASVHYHLLLPQSKDLFHQATMVSGAAICNWAVAGKGKYSPKNTIRTIADSLGCSNTKSSSAIRKCLTAKDSSELVKATLPLLKLSFLPMLFTPRVDGDFLPDHPAQLIKEGKYHKVDILSGVVRDEAAFISLAVYTQEDKLKALQNNFNDFAPITTELKGNENDELNLTKDIFDYYLKGKPIGEESFEQITQLMSDQVFRIPQYMAMQQHASTNKVFLYEFHHRANVKHTFVSGPEYSDYVVGHGEDVIFTLPADFISPELISSPDDLKIKEIMMSSFINFIINGDPNNPKLGVKWEPASTSSSRALKICLEPTMMEDPLGDIRSFWASLPLQVNKILNPFSIRPTSWHLRSNSNEGIKKSEL